MRAPEVFETARLLIRRPAMADADDIFRRYASDPEVTRFLSFRCHSDVAQTQAFIEFSDAEWNRWPAGPYLILSREDGRLLGGTGFSFETSSRSSTGYVLARDAWGRGVATETLDALVRLAPSIGLERLAAICHPAHRASAHVLRKCGFVLEGTLRRYAEYPNLVPGIALDSLSFARVFGDAGRLALGTIDGPRGGVVVRRATTEDRPAWLAMRHELWPDEGDSHARDVDGFFVGTVREPTEALVAVDPSGRLVGFAELSIRPYAEDCETDRVAYLEGWYVAPAARRRGVGRALIDGAEAWARALGCTELGSDAVLDSEASAAAHTAVGFEETVRLRCFRKGLE